MPAPLILTFVSTVAFAVQLMIFAYLYQSHRVRFFQYLLLAWGAYTLSKGLKLVDVLVLGVDHPSFVTDLTTVAAVGLTLAAALAHRWAYRLRARDILIGTAVAVGLTPAGDPAADETQRAVGNALCVVQMAAGLLFWPSGALTDFAASDSRWVPHALGHSPHRDAVRPSTRDRPATSRCTRCSFSCTPRPSPIMVLERAATASGHARLRVVERRATAGELAAGAAHDPKSPVAILNATALLTDETGSPGGARLDAPALRPRRGG
jgi:hypothetical protein